MFKTIYIFHLILNHQIITLNSSSFPQLVNIYLSLIYFIIFICFYPHHFLSHSSIIPYFISHLINYSTHYLIYYPINHLITTQNHIITTKTTLCHIINNS